MRLLTLELLLVFTIISANSLHAQNTSSVIHDLYFSSVAYPEDFDNSFELLSVLVDPNESLACLIDIRDTYFVLAEAAMEHCKNAHGDGTKWYYDCIREDQNASMWFWAAGIISVIQGNQTWINTQSGSTLLTAKQLAESIQPGTWVAAVEWGMPLIRDIIDCR